MLRFAPSPTGDMNIANLRVAIFNYIVAKQKNEDLIIRIEDIDKEKNVEGKDKSILELLNLFSIEYSSVIYQSENLKYHQRIAMQLMTKKEAFSCFCSNDKLEELKLEAKENSKPNVYDGFCATLSEETVFNCNAPFTVRLKNPKENITFIDGLKGDIEYKSSEIDSFNILKHDKTPTYNYACAVDDMLYDISMVIRDEIYLSDTPKQIHLRNMLGYDKKIEYIHLPTILNENTDDDSSINYLIKEGFLPSAIANYLVLLGTNAPVEIFTLEDAIEWFDITKISNNSVKFDIKKLRFINKKHLELMDDLRLSKILGFADSDIGKLAKIYLEESCTINELKSKILPIFEEKNSLESFSDELKTLKECLETAPYYEEFNEFKNFITKETSLKGESLSKPLRYLLTKAENGPDLADLYPFIKNYLGDIIK